MFMVKFSQSVLISSDSISFLTSHRGIEVIEEILSKPVWVFDIAGNLLPGYQVPLLACVGDDISIQLFNSF